MSNPFEFSTKTKKNKQAATKEERKVPVVAGLIWGFMGAIALCILACAVGVISSQYYPVFGGLLELNLAQPWSPARINLIPIHLFAFGVVGLLVGGVFGFGFGYVIEA